MSAIQDFRMSDTLLLNVAIIPPDKIAATVSELSKEAQALGGAFQIDNATRFAHLTLYMSRFRPCDMDSVKAAFLGLKTSLRQNIVEHTGYFVTSGNYYEVSYARTSALLSAHEIVTESIATFRFNPGSPVREAYFGRYSQEQAMNARLWGYDLAGDMYRPHVTLTHFPQRPKADSLPVAQADLSFTASRIGLFQADEMGAARELILAIDLAD
jgi:hypothetical protein